MEQCRQGKSAKWIRNLGKRIGSEGWARGSQSRTRRLSVDCSSCFRGESGSSRAGRGTDWERALRGLFPGRRTVNSELCSECQSEEIQPSAGRLRPVDPGGRHCQVGSLAGAAHLLKDNADELNENRNLVWNKRVKARLILISSTNTNRESVAYRSFSPSEFEARGVRKVTTGITGLWQPSVHSDVAF
ncbi:hypothetical protein GmHk_U060162 [Glycine max]|nr:hypothetical protein GmHk_U060162 [Glycine max]